MQLQTYKTLLITLKFNFNTRRLEWDGKGHDAFSLGYHRAFSLFSRRTWFLRSYDMIVLVLWNLVFRVHIFVLVS